MIGCSGARVLGCSGARVRGGVGALAGGGPCGRVGGGGVVGSLVGWGAGGLDCADDLKEFQIWISHLAHFY